MPELHFKITLYVLNFSVNARDVTDSPYMGYIPKVLVVGEPVDAKTLYYSNYLLKYNNNKKIPHYVLEYITKDKLNGDADRRNCSFMPDPNIPYKFKSTNEDYMYSGFDRGHMVPAGRITVLVGLSVSFFSLRAVKT